LLDKEKDRRETETVELRKMIETEQERAIRAIREAEHNATKIDIFERNAASAESMIKQKEAKIDDLMK
jgi:tropomyosin 2